MLKHFIANHQQEPLLSYVILLMMGEGKTSIILPLLMYILANGEQLAIIIVPSESLRINFNDLRKISHESFKQDIILFDFDRSHDNNPALLQKPYETFLTAIQEKQYIIMTEQTIKQPVLLHLLVINFNGIVLV